MYTQMKQMRILFFDTETSGLPHVRKAPIELVENWPRIVQIAWQVLDFTKEDSPQLVKQVSYILRPDYDTWDAKSESIHGISRERAETEGKIGKDVLREWVEDSRDSVVVAHNLAFDKPVLLAECIRSGFGKDCWPVREYCTMANSTSLLKLPSKYPKPHDPYKYPTLKELVTFLFGSSENIAFHTAGGDVECLVRCFRELLRRRVVCLDTLR